MTEQPSAADWAAARGERWRDQLAGMEGTLAPADEPLIGALQLDAPCRIAEIGSGGGGTTLKIREQAPAGSVVHGYDISPALVERARARVRPGDGGIAFELADMGTAAPPRELYQRLASRFGIMFFDDPPAAFANLARWLAPGGRFAFAVWGPMADNPWMTALRDATAEIVEVPVADPEAPGPFRYAGPDKLRALFDGAGFRHVHVRDWRGTLPIGGGLSAADAASFALAAFSTFGELLAKAGGDAPARGRQALAARLAKHLVDGIVRMDARVHIFTGARS